MILSRRLLVPVVCYLTLTFAPSAIHAQQWRQFRGPGALGVDDQATFPDTWGEHEQGDEKSDDSPSNTVNIRWSQTIDGRGWSSPIVTGDRVFLTTVTRESGEPEAAKPGLYFGGDRMQPPKVVHHWKVICLSLKDGSVVWTRTLHEGLPETPRHIKNSYASETPVTDGRYLYVLFGDVGLYALTVEGDLVWEKKLASVPTRYGWGTAASPILHKDRLYVVNDNDKSSYVTAIDKTSGDEIWKVQREEKSNWATPYIWENELRTELITPGTGKCRSYDLDGNLLYEWGGCSSITIATPYSVHGLLYVSSGYVGDKKRPLFAIKPGAEGDITLDDDTNSNDHIAWCVRQGAPYNPTTMVYGDMLYVLLDRGITATYDARTGETIHKPNRISGGRAFTASPWASRDRLYCLNEFGTTFVFQTGKDFKLLHKNQLPGDEFYMATPAIAGDQLLIRSDKKLYCVGR